MIQLLKQGCLWPLLRLRIFQCFVKPARARAGNFKMDKCLMYLFPQILKRENAHLPLDAKFLPNTSCRLVMYQDFKSQFSGFESGTMLELNPDRILTYTYKYRSISHIDFGLRKPGPSLLQIDP